MKTLLFLFLISTVISCQNTKKDLDNDNSVCFLSHVINERNIQRIYEIPINIDTNYFNDKTILENFSYDDLKKHRCRLKKFDLEKISKYGDLIFETINNDTVEFYNNNISELREYNAYYSLSNPIFNFDNSKALVRIIYKCGRYCSYDELCYYTKESDNWKLKLKVSETDW